MKKILKWGSIVIGSLIILFVGITFLGNFFSGSANLKQSEQILKGSRLSYPPSSPSKDMTADFSITQNPSTASQESMGEAKMESWEDNNSSTPELQTTEKKIIKSGDLYLRVGDAEEAVDKISQIAQKNQGEIFASNISRVTNEQIKEGYVTVKVPFNNFEKTFDELKEVASLILSESVLSQDITEQYTDLQSRLKNKQVEEASFLKILEQSGKIDDVLMVTQALSRTREEIEVLQGRIRLMENQTEMSSIRINITEDAEIQVADTWRPWQVIKNSVNRLIKSLQGFVDFIIKLVIQVIPILLLIGLIFWILYKIGKGIFLRLKEKK
jgi:hypothetical protein